MKLLILSALAAVAVAAPKEGVADYHVDLEDFSANADYSNHLINALVNQLINYIRNVINNGSTILGIPVLDPLNIEEYNLKIPTGIINLDLDLKNVYATGLGQFVVKKSNMNLRDLTFDIDIFLPAIHAEAEHYDLVGDLFTAIPLYGKGGAVFNADGFRFRALVFFKQSDDGKAVIIDRIENAGFDFPHFKSNLNGAIGGGDIDYIVNAMAEEVFFDYVNRFRGAIASSFARALPNVLNPMLEHLDTWRFIAPLIPRN